MRVVHAFDSPEVVAGQATVGLEIARQAPATRVVVVPLGGGGLAGGIGLAMAAALPDARVVGVQAAGCAPYIDSLAAHRPIGARSANTICDGIAVKRPGDYTLPIVERYVDEVVTVSDDEVAEAMVLLLERSKLVVEGAGAVAVAALMHGRVPAPEEGEVCAVLSGGNVDASLLSECIRLGETVARRRVVLSTVVPDRPGALSSLLAVVAEHGGNVVDVEHLRDGVELHVGETAIKLVLQTRGPGEQRRDPRGRPGRGLLRARRARRLALDRGHARRPGSARPSPLRAGSAWSSASSCCDVSSTSTAAAFSSRYFSRLVPGIGTTSSPWWRSHASASCAGVQPTSSAISRTLARSSRLCSRAPSWKRGRKRRKSSSASMSSAPVSSPRPSGL